MVSEHYKATCPYCNIILEKRPERKKKCPSCGKYIFVKTLPTTREKVLVTESQAEEIEQQWKSLYEYKKWMEILSSHGVKDSNYESEKQQLSTKLKREVADLEVVYSLFEKLVHETNDYSDLKSINYEMALLLEEEGRNFKPYLEKAAECELLKYKESGVVKKVQILSAGIGNSCEECQKQDKNIYTIEEALKIIPIPCINCTLTISGKREGFCRCIYLAVIE